MTFRQFAFNNVVRNKQTYAAFFLSSVFSVMIFFVYAMFIFHPDIENGDIHHSAVMAMRAAEYIIFLFAFFFLFYSVSAFLKKREKEFGVLYVHGMTRWQQNTLVFLENMIIGLFAITLGILLGMVFAKLFFLFAGFLLDTEALPFYLPWEAIGLTSLAFFVLFITISIFTLLFLRRKSLLELLKGSQKPKSEPKASILLTIIAIGLLGTGYILSFMAQGAAVPILLLPVSAIVIVGTYLLFSQASVFTIRSLKRNKLLFWRHTNLITFSDLAYRMKDNARMFFLVSIVSTVAFCAVGSLASFSFSLRSSVEQMYPFAMSYSSTTGNTKETEQLAMIESALQQNQLKYDKYSITARIQTDTSKDQYGEVSLVRVSDYNKYADILHKAHLTLQDNQAVELTRPSSQNQNQAGKVLSLQENKTKLQITGTTEDIIQNGYGYEEYVVSDQVYDQIGTQKQRVTVGFVIPEWTQTREIGEQLDKTIGYSDKAGVYSFQNRAVPYYEMKQMYNTTLFVGLFVGVLFFVASGSFLYFRLYTDLDADKRQYMAINKIGLTQKELSRIVTIQIALLFFAPILVAIIHSAVAFVSLQSLMKLLGVTSILMPTSIVLSSFLIVQVAYFLVIRARYLYHLKQAIQN